MLKVAVTTKDSGCDSHFFLSFEYVLTITKMAVSKQFQEDRRDNNGCD